MKVQELINSINTENFDLASAIEVKTYLPINLKKVIAQEIVYECVDDSEGFAKVDSFTRYMSYVKHMIQAHTNLEYTDEDYDVLCSTPYREVSLLNAILGTFGEDAKECSRILEIIMADYMQDSTLEVVLSKALRDFSNTVQTVVSSAMDMLGENMPDGVDVKQLQEFLNKNQ